MRIIEADVLAGLAQLDDGSVHCVVCSPPYWGLRDYGIEASIWSGEPRCEHEWGQAIVGKSQSGSLNGSTLEGTPPGTERRPRWTSAFCGRCAAWRGTLGLEPTPELYVAHMAEVFCEVRRVLRDDGTLWLNLGDCYTSGNSGQRVRNTNGGFGGTDGQRTQPATKANVGRASYGSKPKDLVGIPWRVAFALQADGWWLRSDIIWSKPNPMPESVQDRPTRSHEYVFLFAKGQWKSRVVQFSNLPCQRFHFSQYFRPDSLPMRGAARLPVDLASAIFDCAEREYESSLPPLYSEVWQEQADGSDTDLVRGLPEEHRAAVWAARFLGAKATAEQFLCEIDRIRIAHSDGDDFLKRWTTSSTGADAPSITSNGNGAITIYYPGEVCQIKFASHTVIISRPSQGVYYYDSDAIREPHTDESAKRYFRGSWYTGDPDATPYAMKNGPRGDPVGRNKRSVWTIATQSFPGAHFATFPEALVKPCILAGSPEGGMILDPFAGSGTVGIVAQRAGRNAVLIDVNPAYCEMMRERLAQTALLWEVGS